MMTDPVLLSLSALAALLPAALLPFRRDSRRPDVLFWVTAAVATAGPVVASISRLQGAWQTSFSTSLWITVAATMIMFVVAAAVLREAWRLASLLMPYLVGLGVLASAWAGAPPHADVGLAASAWLTAHVVASVATYGLATLAAVAGAAVLVQERAVKRKAPTALTHKLPSISDASALQVRLLAAAAVVLALGILTGVAEEYVAHGQLLVFNHKILLTFLALAVVVVLLILHQRTGLRGQRAARLILLAYLLLTLAYPGVKFVTDVLLA
ncbi:MAG TPA: cytochrome c biogenesis protein CcsA [Kiloniellales bacterium]